MDDKEHSTEVSEWSSLLRRFSGLDVVWLEYSRLRVKGESGASTTLDGCDDEEEEEEVELDSGRGKEEEEEDEEEDGEVVPYTAHTSPRPPDSSPIKSTTSSLQVKSIATRLLLVPQK